MVHEEWNQFRQNRLEFHENRADETLQGGESVQDEKEIASRKSQYFKGQAKKRKFVKSIDRENLKRHMESELWAQCQYLKDLGSSAIKYYKQKDIR